MSALPSLTEQQQHSIHGGRRAGDQTQISRVRNLIDWRRCYSLVGRRYDDRGLRTALTPPAGAEPHVTTLKAVDGRRLVGTISVRLDSAQGLAADKSFPEDMQSIRQGPDTPALCEFTRLATWGAPNAQLALARLFHMAYLLADLYGATRLVMEVNPRHVRHYQRLFGADIVATGHNDTVDAPSVLMTLPFAYARQQMNEFGGQPDALRRARTLYPLMPAPHEEDLLRARLVAETEAGA